MANGIVLNIDTTKSEFQNPMVQLRQGDGNYQSLDVTVTSNGEPLDLTGWTTTFMGTTAGGFKIVDSAVTVTNALQGEFTYTPTKAWGQDQGEFKNAYFKFTKADETASGASFRVNVLDAVDLTAEEAKDYISIVDQTINKLSGDLSKLQTSVDDLKAQNNAIKTSDNTWSGTNTFTKPINGSFSISQAQFTDFADVANNMNTYSGKWFVSSEQSILNSPLKNSIYLVEVIPADATVSGKIILTPYDGLWDGSIYYSIVNWRGLSQWSKIAQDSQVMHLTRNETVAGDNTFTGNNTFNKKIIAASGVQGNSDSATKLQTPRKINGTDFDGTADINVPASNDSDIVHKIGSETVSGNKTFTGNDRFTNPVYGSLATNSDWFTSFADVAKNMRKYAGYTSSGTGYVTDMPYPGYGIIHVQPFSDGASMNNTGLITIIYTNTPTIVIGHVNGGEISWEFTANDAKVVHNTGTEKINGDKTFISGNYGLRVTTSGIQKTSDGGTTWVNI